MRHKHSSQAHLNSQEEEDGEEGGGYSHTVHTRHSLTRPSCVKYNKELQQLTQQQPQEYSALQQHFHHRVLLRISTQFTRGSRFGQTKHILLQTGAHAHVRTSIIWSTSPCSSPIFFSSSSSTRSASLCISTQHTPEYIHTRMCTQLFHRHTHTAAYLQMHTVVWQYMRWKQSLC